MACSTSGSRPKRVMPPTYLLASLVAVVALRVALPALAFSAPVTVALGLALLLSGIILNLAADQSFKRRGTAVSPDAAPSALINAGVFRLTRNPMYLGMVFIIASVSLLIGAPVGLAVAVAMLLILDRSFVPGEERRLEAAFGGEYAEYKAAVRRWV